MTTMINKASVPTTTEPSSATTSTTAAGSAPAGLASAGSAPAARSAPGRSDVPGDAKILLNRLGDLPVHHPDRHWIRDRVANLCLPLAEHLAARFRNRGEPDDDLRQVAAVGLLKAIDGFDPTRGVDFSGYAVPTIVGELKRHFRDKGWTIRVPRRLQELKLDIARAVSTLTQNLQRSPSVTDIAGYLGCSEEDVLEGMDAAHAYSAISLAAPASSDTSSLTTVADQLGFDDSALERVDDRATLRPLLAQLPEREQRIIAMRFFDNMTQSEIAENVGISQMHVSRLLTKSLRLLREGMLAE
ncbi:MAG: RNA polymerase sigma factor SigF [Micromonosporaceae bacterium]